jgi:hypothetical protein
MNTPAGEGKISALGARQPAIGTASKTSASQM